MGSRTRVAAFGFPVISLILVAVATPGAAPSLSRPGRAAGPLPPHRPGEVILKFRPETAAGQRSEVLSRLGGERRRRFLGGEEHRILKQGLSTEEAIEDLEDDPALEYIEPNYIVRATALPNDPNMSLLYGMLRIQAPAAWDISTGSRDILVGVIDTGIDYTHPDLAANIWTNPGEIPGNGIDDEGNGYVDDVHGWDFAYDDNDPKDGHFHGTHVAGTIGAVGNNGIGVVGVNWRVTLAAIKFLDDGGYGTTADAIAAIDYSILIGARITNNSWGGFGYSRSEEAAVRRAGAANQLFVAAAGNDATNTDDFPFSPASIRLPNAVTVAATDSHDQMASFSNYGAQTVDLGAPGVGILSTVPPIPPLTIPSYRAFSGTSMASPHVAGAAALLLSIAPDMTAPQLRQRLMESTDPLPPLAGRTVTGGRLNVLRMLSSRETVPPGAVGNLTSTGLTSNSVTLDWFATGDDGDAGRSSLYDLRYSTEPMEDDAAFRDAARVRIDLVPAPPGAAERVEVTGLQPATQYHFGLLARDEWGNPGPLQVTSASTLGPPRVDVSPRAFSALVEAGGATDVLLSIRNEAEGTLDWTIPPQTPLPPLVGDPPIALPEPPGGGSILRYGGPDPYGYRFVDSSEPDGPRFHWDDISTEVLIPLTGDEEVSEPIPLGFSFPFYGEDFDSVRVCSNGYLSFTSDYCDWLNVALPSTLAAGNMISPWWHDLDLGQRYRVSVRRDEGSFTLQFTDAPRYYLPDSKVTFQATLFQAGDILFQYLETAEIENWGTIGIQDGEGARGLLIAHDHPYLHDGMAVRITRQPRLATPGTESGRVRPGEQQDVSLRLDATQLTAGRYPGVVPVHSNDPVNPLLEIPFTLDVTGEASLELLPATLDLGSTLVGASRWLPLTLANHGNGEIQVDIVPEGVPGVTVEPSSVVLDPLSRRTVKVVHAPSGAGGVSGSLALSINEGRSPSIHVGVSGTAIVPPRIEVSAPALHETLHLGAVLERSLRVSNTGGADLHLMLSRDMGNLPIATDVFSNGGFESGALSGWTTGTNGLAEVLPWTVVAEGGGRYHNTRPIEGSLDLVSGFEGEGGLETTLFQSILIPALDGPLRLLFNDRIQFSGQGLHSTAPRVYEVTLLSLLNQPLATILREEVLLDGAPYTDTGWREHSLDLTPYKSRRVGLLIRQSIPESVTGAASLEIDGFRVEVGEPPRWMQIGQEGAVIPPDGSLDVTVTFDARDLAPGEYSAAIDLEGLEGEGAMSVPIGLTVLDAPDLKVSRPITLMSSSGYSGFAAVTRHRMEPSVPPAAGGQLELMATGVFGATLQTATLLAEGRTIGQVGGTGTDCLTARGTFPVTAEDLAALVADGSVDLEVRNSSAVGDYCPENVHRVALRYEGPLDVIAFGPVGVGGTARHAILLRNTGTEPLDAALIPTDVSRFTVSPPALTLGPGQEQSVEIAFTPDREGLLVQALDLQSNDPDHPSFRFGLLGLAGRPPEAFLAPDALTAALPPGQASVSRTIRVGNHGGFDLHWNISSDLPAWMVVESTEGTVPPGGEGLVAVRLSSDALADGDYAAALIVSTDDPSLRTAEIPVALHVGYAPVDRFSVTPPALNTSMQGNLLVSLQLPASYDPRQVRVSSVSLQGVVFARPSPVRYADTNHDGVRELILMFDRRDVLAAVSGSGDVTLTVTGEVRDVTWFRGETIVRVSGKGRSATTRIVPRRRS